MEAKTTPLKSVPIENLYFLLLYAFDALEESGPADAQPAGHTKLVDLFADVLLRATDRLIRRGISRNYLPQTVELAGIRGKLDLAASIRSGVLFRGMSFCQFDEPTYDTSHNRILKASLTNLLRAPSLSRKLREPVTAVCRQLGEISNVVLSDRLFHVAQPIGAFRHYRVPLALCRLLHSQLMIDQTTGHYLFREFSYQQSEMAALFQKFLRNFAAREQSHFRVGASSFAWPATSIQPRAMRLMPRMFTDVTLVDQNRRIILEAKFYRHALVRRHGKWKLRSGHLYQIFAYLQNMRATHPGVQIDGVLIYPQVRRRIRARYEIAGHSLFVWTINLQSPWKDVHAELLSLLGGLT